LLPLLLFVLELCVIHELFSLSEDCIHFFFYALGITSVFAFAITTILIYHNPCAQHYITLFLFITSGILFMLAFRNTVAHRERRERAAGNG
jgi:quinol-cytochrome oxidoreductase complex cytochrome b subunit